MSEDDRSQKVFFLYFLKIGKMLKHRGFSETITGIQELLSCSADAAVFSDLLLIHLSQNR